MQTRLRSHTFLAVALCSALAASALLAPGAGAATVVNGDFETGTLSGWTLRNLQPQTEFEPLEDPGSWFAYSGSVSPLTPPPESDPQIVPPPPAGTYAAITAQNGPGAHFLFQDVSLEPYYSHELSMLVYYRSDADLLTPNPNTLVPREQELMLEGPLVEPEQNQQYRIDVIKPTAPLESLAPEDILATVFATKTGDPTNMAATTYTADLTAFAGQTVRLRLAEVDEGGFFFAGADSVAVQSTPPANAFKLGKRKLNKKKGTATLTVTVPGPGVVTLATTKGKKGKKKPPKLVKQVKAIAKAAGKVKLKLKPTAKGKAALAENGKLKAKLTVGFTPTGGLLATKNVGATLKLTPPK